MVKILFVCMGNICRSPTAEGVFLQKMTQAGLSEQIHIDSAGTHAYHIGEPPDSRTQQAALQRGFDLSTLRARQVRHTDFEEFDYILAMDQRNYQLLRQQCPANLHHKLALLLDFAPQLGTREVPDPYYGGKQEFEKVLDLVETASEGLLTAIQQRLANENDK